LLEQKNAISVVIPAFNAERSILKTLKSIQEQSAKCEEIIVVDDGSRDGTMEVARPLASNVIRTENRGPAAARNTGIRQASGDIIALIDSDCEADRTWIENIDAVFADPEISVIMGRVIIPPSTRLGDAISALGFPAGGSIGFEKIWTVAPDGHTSTLSTCNCAFRREIFERFGPFDEDFPYAGGEDTLFAAGIIRSGVRIKYCPEVRVSHEPRTSFRSFLHWQMQRGKCALLFKRKIGNVNGFARTRLWSTKNVISESWRTKKFPLVILLLFLSYLLQTLGFVLAFIRNPSPEKRVVR